MTPQSHPTPVRRSPMLATPLTCSIHALLVTLTPGRLANGDDVPREAINAAIEKGLLFLRHAEENLGDDPELTPYPGGIEALVFYTLLMNGLPATDPFLARLEQVVVASARDVDHTYTLSLSLLGLLVRDRTRHATVIQELIGRLEAGQFHEGQGAGAWGYVLPSGRSGLKPDASGPIHPEAHWEPKKGWWDHSNTQFAILALRSAVDYGFQVDPLLFRESLAHFLKERNSDGGWGYTSSSRSNSYVSMTAGVLGSALLCSDLLGDDEDSARLVGQLEKQAPKGIEWLGRRMTFPAGDAPWPYYSAYAVERLGHFASIDQIGGHDWYQLGARWLVSAQRDDGAFSVLTPSTRGDSRGGRTKKNRLQRTGSSSPVADTCFALLFLKRSSFVHTLVSDEVMALLKGLDPQASDATVERVRERILKADKRAVAQLVKGLFLPHRVARELSASCLRHITGENMRYADADDPEAERESRQRWVEYLMKHPELRGSG